MTPHAQRLYDAITTNDLDAVRAIIAKKQAIFAHEDRYRNGVLHWAAGLDGGDGMLQLLLSAPNRPTDQLDRFNNAHETPLIVAAREDRLDQAQRLLDAGANPNRQYRFMGDQNGALHKATGASMVQLLVKAGARLEARNTSMLTPLLEHAMLGEVAAFDALLDAGADLHARATRNAYMDPGLDGSNALHLAAAGRWPGSPAMVARLLALGFSPLTPTPTGTTALQIAREQALLSKGERSGNLQAMEDWLLRQAMNDQPLPESIARPRL